MRLSIEDRPFALVYPAGLIQPKYRSDGVTILCIAANEFSVLQT